MYSKCALLNNILKFAEGDNSTLGVHWGSHDDR